jgi:hypothetical protein
MGSDESGWNLSLSNLTVGYIPYILIIAVLAVLGLVGLSVVFKGHVQF